MATVLDRVGTSLTQGALLGMAVQAALYSCRRRSGRRILKYLPGRGAERDGAGRESTAPAREARPWQTSCPRTPPPFSGNGQDSGSGGREGPAFSSAHQSACTLTQQQEQTAP